MHGELPIPSRWRWAGVILAGMLLSGCLNSLPPAMAARAQEMGRPERSPSRASPATISNWQPLDDRAALADRVRRGLLTAFFIAYFFIFGGVVGSFLNVVAYRLPRGQGLVWPGSRCPICRTPIRLSDNIPILSWFRLRGRCRACQAAIPMRYMLVEALTASLFLGLALVELLSGGANLPLRTPNPLGGVVNILWETKWDLVGIYLYHACLLSLLVAVVLIDLDRQPTPGRLMVFGLAAGMLPPLLWPGLRPLPLAVPPPAWLTTSWSQGLADGLAGAIAGTFLGISQELGSRLVLPRLRFGGASVYVLTLAGAWLGWQAAVLVGVTAAILRLLAAGLLPAFPSLRRVTDPAWMAVAVGLVLVVWRMIDEGLWRPGSVSWHLELLLAALGIGLVSFVTSWAAPRDVAPKSAAGTSEGEELPSIGHNAGEEGESRRETSAESEHEHE